MAENVPQSQTKPQVLSDEEAKKYGYDLYPERRSKYEPTWGQVITGMGGNEKIEKIKCEKKVYNCVKNSPIVKLMMGALARSGCPIDIRRHISCETCKSTVNGGYDPMLNQIVICQNVARGEGIIQGILMHEMIHMFDYCNNKLDFKNIDHLACTEIRAANLAHCSFLSAVVQGDVSPFNIKEQHKMCVMNKAMLSIMAVRSVSKEEAMRAVARVFDKCYADLEPVGRRIKSNSTDMFKAYTEGHMYGYTYNSR